MRYEEDSPVNKLVKMIPHVAFEVDDVSEAINYKQILIEPNSLTEGVLVAFVVDNGAPIEIIHINKK